MQLQHIVFSLLVLLLTDYGLASSKTSTSTKVSPTTKAADKTTYPKKVSTLKKRPSKPSLKKVADITDKFKDLPADDLAFIKELDKQFKLHGGKVKIKVENDNSTNTKNSKRTIEGDLGYGYSHNGYDYSPPKYMFYPYSQSDISHNAPKYFIPDGKTEVSIEPSYSYELKPQSYVDHDEQQQIDVPHAEHEQSQHDVQPQQEEEHQAQPQPQHQQYDEPVIVLRIPGPAKYASHLQTLLQQYLEIRAAQYLRILEESEQRQQHQQHHQHQQLQQVEYTHGQEQEQVHQSQQQPQVPVEQHDYHQQQVQAHYEPQQQPQYPDIDHVYQHYKHRHQSSNADQPAHQQPEQHEQLYYIPNHAEAQQQHYVPQQQQQQHQHQHQEEQPQFYYTHEQQYAQQAGPPANTYQHIFLVSMAGQAHTGYESEHIQPELQQPQHQPVYVPEQEEHHQHFEEHSSPILTENNPRSSHTKVIFTPNAEHAGADYTSMYPLPSIKPNERHSPKSVPDYHQDYQEQPHPYNLQQESQATAQHYQQHEQVVAAAPESAQHQQAQQVVAITQRPYNYHAHGVKPRTRGRGVHKRRSASALKNEDHDLQKIRDYVRDNLGARPGSDVEYKSTKVI